MTIATQLYSLLSVQALDKVLSENGYGCLERNIPILCFGDGKDMELTLCSDSNISMPLGTRVSHMKVILFVKYVEDGQLGSYIPQLHHCM